MYHSVSFWRNRKYILESEKLSRNSYQSHPSFEVCCKQLSIICSQDQVKRDLLSHEIAVEDYGGDVQVVHISALKVCLPFLDVRLTIFICEFVIFPLSQIQDRPSSSYKKPILH